MKLSIVFLPTVFLILINCTNEKKIEGQSNPNDPLILNRDTTVNPATDFFHYANGGWFNRNPIPASESSNGIFRTIVDTINGQIKKICEKSALAKAENGSNRQKIGDFYTSGMDTLAIEAAGLKPLAEELEKIDALSDNKSLISEIAYLHTVGARPAFGFYVSQDDKISTKYAVYFRQAGLGLGNRDYYFNTDARTVNIRQEYTKHIQAMLRLLGQREEEASKNATAIINLETDLARSSRKLEALRDPIKNYNKMSLEQFNKMTPAIPWNNMLPVLGIKSADSVIVQQPEFFKTLNTLLAKYPINNWKVYLKWNLLRTYASYLNKTVEQENFKFYSTVLNGVTKQKPRWKRVVEKTDDYLGELIGQVYVEECLPKGTKDKLVEIGTNIRDVFATHIKQLDWMSDSTKVIALNKLSKMVMKVAYPDKWKDMSNLQIKNDSYCANVMRAEKWFYNFQISKYGKPVDRTEWGMQPQTYNAYYNSSNNEIVVPACNIIVPGFEGRLPDDAILYSIIGGSTFGHEFTHGFDDEGSQYDENGNLKNWWTPGDRKKFVSKTKRIVDQYNQYIAVDSLYLNGDATQGENIADLGGVVMGYEAFKKTEQYTKNQIINGLTPDQRYFQGYALAWMVNRKKETLSRMVMTDFHSPEKFRVNGPLSNIPGFYKAFNLKNGDPMYRADSLRVAIW